MCLVLSGSVRHFEIALLWKFTNHDDFAPTVRYGLVFHYTTFRVFVTDDHKPRLSLILSPRETRGGWIYI